MLRERYERLLTEKSDMQFHLPKLAEVGRGKSVIEIGFRTGVSATAFLHGGCRSLVSIDIAECEVPIEMFDDERFQFVHAPSTSVDCRADVVMIDGDHSYRGVLADLAYWPQRCRERLVMHDTSCKKWPGVRVALGQFLMRGGWVVEYETKECYGLTILRRA